MDYEFNGIQIEQEKGTDQTDRLKAYAETTKKAQEEKENGAK